MDTDFSCKTLLNIIWGQNDTLGFISGLPLPQSAGFHATSRTREAVTTAEHGVTLHLLLM